MLEKENTKIDKINNNIQTIVTNIVGDMNQYLVFKIGDEEYALDVLSVQEILGVTNITPVPGSPIYMLGLINLRGNILHVIDLRVRFSIPRDPDHNFQDDVIIVLSTVERRFGVLADMVIDVINVNKDQISDAPIESLSGLQISHVIKLDDKVVMVLPVDEVVMSEEELNKDK